MSFDNKNLINEIKQKVAESQEKEINVVLEVLDEWLAYCNTPKFEENFEQMLFNSIGRGCERAILRISFNSDPEGFATDFKINCDKEISGGLGDQTLSFQSNSIEKYLSTIEEKIEQIVQAVVSRVETINGVSVTYHNDGYRDPEYYGFTQYAEYYIYIDW